MLGRPFATAQAFFIDSHGSEISHKKERECLHEFLSISAAEENFLKQKSRNQWLNLGDGNNGFFYKMVKVRNSFNLVKSLKDVEGNLVEGMQRIKQLTIDFYQTLLGDTSHVFSQ